MKNETDDIINSEFDEHRMLIGFLMGIIIATLFGIFLLSYLGYV
jgi:hypothetical protein